jgi:hypothetical protein
LEDFFAEAGVPLASAVLFLCDTTNLLLLPETEAATDKKTDAEAEADKPAQFLSTGRGAAILGGLLR